MFGATMMYHGWNKISSGISGTAKWFASIGMKWPKLQANVAAYSEIGAGLLVAAGFATGLGATIFIALMLVAIATVHAKVGFFIFLPNGGWEYCGSIAVVATALSLTGPGKYSLDELFNTPGSVFVWALPVGALLAVCHLAITYRPQGA